MKIREPREDMTARKSERLLNLLITLLVSRTYVSKDRLREVVEPYREAGDEAFEKMFERDKEELRSLGIPIEVGYVDRAFEDEPGYRVERSAFELPEIDLAPEEAAVIGLAARVWQHAGLAAATSDALVKLKAAGVSVDRAALDLVQPTLNAEEPSFEPFWDATRTRTPVTFGYRTSRASTTASRGAWCPTAAGGTSPATTPTAASPASSGCPGCRVTSAPTASPARSRSRRAPTCAP